MRQVADVQIEELAQPLGRRERAVGRGEMDRHRGADVERGERRDLVATVEGRRPPEPARALLPGAELDPIADQERREEPDPELADEAVLPHAVRSALRGRPDAGEVLDETPLVETDAVVLERHRERRGVAADDDGRLGERGVAAQPDRDRIGRVLHELAHEHGRRGVEMPPEHPQEPRQIDVERSPAHDGGADHGGRHGARRPRDRRRRAHG